MNSAFVLTVEFAVARGSTSSGLPAATDLETGVGRMVEWAKVHGPRKTAKFSEIEILRNLPPSWRE